jgi:hypothetical protein
MPMKVSLTDIGVRALKAPDTGQTTVWDANSPLGVRISQGGSKSYVVMLGSGKRHTIGRAGVLKLAEAREEAKRLLAEKTLGLIKKPSPITFGAALPQFLEEHYRGKRPRTKKEATRLLEKHFLPAFRATLLSDVSDQDIGRRLAKLAQTPGEQLHAFRMLRTFLRWCTRPPRRYIPHSPLEGYPAPAVEKKGTRVLTDEELVKVWRARTDEAGDFVRLLILWGTRNTETAVIEPTWVEEGMLTIPGQFTKNHRAHSIPLQPMALDILERQAKGSRYFFPGRTEGSRISGWSALKQSIDKAVGFSDWQLRDIRRTFRSNMAKLRVPREVAEILLNHITGAGKNDLDEIYDRYDYLEEKAAALKKWEDRIAELLARH